MNSSIPWIAPRVQQSVKIDIITMRTFYPVFSKVLVGSIRYMNGNKNIIEIAAAMFKT